jgi:hypothetical protein
VESKEEILTYVILLIGEASGVFAGFCPSWFTVSSPFFHEQEAKAGNIKRIRWGEAAATSIVVATGFAVSKVTKSKFPLLASVLISGIFVAGYEYMIANPSKSDGEPTANGGLWMIQSSREGN